MAVRFLLCLPRSRDNGGNNHISSKSEIFEQQTTGSRVLEYLLIGSFNNFAYCKKNCTINQKCINYIDYF